MRKADIASTLKTTDNPARQRALFTALLSREMSLRGAPAPIVVGGEAVEIYTQGSYTTGDIDLKARRGVLMDVLKEFGFKKIGRMYVQKDWDIWVDWAGATLDEGEEAERRTRQIIVSKDEPRLTVRVISLEDLIVDRCMAAKNWKDADSEIWAKTLMKLGEEPEVGLDRKYLETCLKRNAVMDIYLRLRKDRPAGSTRGKRRKRK